MSNHRIHGNVLQPQLTFFCHADRHELMERLGDAFSVGGGSHPCAHEIALDVDDQSRVSVGTFCLLLPQYNALPYRMETRDDCAATIRASETDAYTIVRASTTTNSTTGLKSTRHYALSAIRSIICSVDPNAQAWTAQQGLMQPRLKD